MNILLVYPEFPDTFWSFKHALKFVQKKSSSPPLGLLTVAAMLPEDWKKRLVDLNVRALEDQEIHWADLVMVSAMVVQRDSAREVIQRCKLAGKRVIAGGPIFTGEWEDFPQVDHFILNEAEITLPQFLRDDACGAARRVYSTAAYADIHQTPAPLWELIDFRAYDSLCIQFSRGCPYNCDFCNITAMLGHYPRTKSKEQIIHELDAMYRLGWRRNIFFVDDNFIGNRRQLKEEILPALIEWRKGKKGCSFITEASINLADDPVLMDLMARAGFVSVFVGIETPEDEGLAECNKKHNRHRDLLHSVQVLHRHGLQVMGGFIVGFDSDGVNVFQKQVEFIQKSGIVTAMVGILQAPFGTKLYERMENEGRLVKQMTGNNTSGLTNIIPKMGLARLQQGYHELLAEIYKPEGFYGRVRTFLETYKVPPSSVYLQMEEVFAFFKSIWELGIKGKERKEYWRLFFWTLFRHPRKFALAITLAIYGYHFRHVFETSETTQ